MLSDFSGARDEVDSGEEPAADREARGSEGAPLSTHTTLRPRLPAFGAELLALRRRGQVPAPHLWWGHAIVCLDSWDWAKDRTRVVVPSDADPATLDFSMLGGLAVTVAYRPHVTSVARRDALLTNLVRSVVAWLFVFDMDAPRNGFFVKSHAVGLERTEYA